MNSLHGIISCINIISFILIISLIAKTEFMNLMLDNAIHGNVPLNKITIALLLSCTVGSYPRQYYLWFDYFSRSQNNNSEISDKYVHFCKTMLLLKQLNLLSCCNRVIAQTRVRCPTYGAPAGFIKYSTQPGKELDFSDHRKVFKDKTIWELTRGLLVLGICSFQWFSINSLKVSVLNITIDSEHDNFFHFFLIFLSQC